MIKLYESVPEYPTIRLSEWYMNNWLYIYRYEKQDKADVISRMLNKAGEMAAEGYYFDYVNPSWGPIAWCCVTFVSYLASVGTGHTWKMGNSNQGYLWSPRYDGAYDEFLIDLGFTKYNFSDVIPQSGDIIQSFGHAALCYEQTGGFKVDEMPTLKKGSKGNVVINLQILLNYWMCQNGTYQPLLVDGDFGSVTETRLKNYQRLQGLYIDGICGYQTWRDILLT